MPSSRLPARPCETGEHQALVAANRELALSVSGHAWRLLPVTGRHRTDSDQLSGTHAAVRVYGLAGARTSTPNGRELQSRISKQFPVKLQLVFHCLGVPSNLHGRKAVVQLPRLS